MKDKLYKNHHRGVYYRVKAFFISFVLVCSGLAVAVIPTYIILNDTAKQTTKAEPEVVEKEEENDEPKEEYPLAYMN